MYNWYDLYFSTINTFDEGLNFNCVKKQISILGTGWLGFPLAQALLNDGSLIKGSTTSENKLKTLQTAGIDPFLIAVNKDQTQGDIAGFLKGSILLIINIPPGLRRDPNADFVSKIKHLIPHIENSKIEKVLFISSTSVFMDEEDIPIITQDIIPNATSLVGKQLISAEQLLQQNSCFNTTILRFSGLFGPNRHPATMLSGRQDLKNPDAPVNLIHLEDCIGIIRKIIATNSWHTVFNVSFPEHPPKSKYYSTVCKEMGLPFPKYDLNTPSIGKIIDSSKAEEVFDYRFKKGLDAL